MRGRAIRHHDFAHDESAILASAVRVDGDWFEHAIRALAFSLLGGATVETPERKFFKLGETGEFFDLSLATKIWHRFVTVEPDVFQFVFSHGFKVVVFEFE
jgi:hypothetical protein